MRPLSASIPKQPALKPAEDYYRLRREGIGFIEQMGSQLWTDYNTHDPGITTLEALCYAITDLAYRTGWDIKDILAPATSPGDPNQPFPSQAFFTAREILTVNPWTPDDFRRLLIDLDMVRNAWVYCKECACDVYYYAWCEKGQLRLSYRKPVNPNLQPKKVEPLGLYEILLELESDPDLGDLNDRKIERRFNVFDADNKPYLITMELRFPEWGLASGKQYRLFLTGIDAVTELNARFGATRTFNIFGESEGAQNEYLRRHWRNLFYVDFEITLGTEIITIEDATMRLFGDATAITALKLKELLEDTSPGGFMHRYRAKLLQTEDAVASAKAMLYKHRNLDEDYCRVRGVDVEDVAVCARGGR